MDRLGDIREQQRETLDRMRELAAKVALALPGSIGSLSQGVEMLVALRKASHEETNQLLHEALLLEAAVRLEREYRGQQLDWAWNPRQSGTAAEPDLQGTVNGRVEISLEATAAHAPLDSRIKHTLAKLAGLPGRRIYCVRTPEICQRALTKVRKAGYDIEAWLMPGRLGGHSAS